MSIRFSVLFVFSLLLIGFVGAQLEDVKEQITDTTESLQNNITKAKEFTEKDKWDFIGSQWKELLLKNKVIAGVDATFTEANVVFVFLFARDYSLSLGMLFVFTFWLFILLILPKFVKFLRIPLIFSPKFFEKGLNRFLFSLGGTIILAHTGLFRSLSEAAERAVRYKISFWWRIAIFIAIFAGLFLCLKLGDFISKSLQRSREESEKEELKERVERGERFTKNMVETAHQVAQES